MISKINEAKARLEDGQLQIEISHLASQGTQLRVSKELAGVRNQIKRRDQDEVITITAVKNGTVASLAVQPGSPVAVGQTLLTLIPPNEPLQATVYIPSRLIGKIYPEQPLLLSFDAFPVSEFGYTDAQVKSISTAPLDPRETLLPVTELNEPVFKVVAELSRHYVEGPDIYPLLSGIQFSADFVVEDLSLIEFIFKPVLKLRGKIL